GSAWRGWRLVEDRVRHARHRPGHHDLGSEYTRQPSPLDHALVVARNFARGSCHGLGLSRVLSRIVAGPVPGSGPCARRTLPTIPPFASLTPQGRTPG